MGQREGPQRRANDRKEPEIKIRDKSRDRGRG
jgi:hypothetical protein